MYSYNYSYIIIKQTEYDVPTKLLKTKNVHTLRPLSDLVSIMVRTVSYKMALPTFLLVSVFVAT